MTELCRVTTEDGLRLDGALQEPSSAAGDWPVDAFLLVHGTTGNFYQPGVLETFSKQALDAGVVTLRINTRGHDEMSSIPGSPKSRRGGAAFESVAESRYDLRAWIDFLVSRGRSRIALVGHSMGGVKSLRFMQTAGGHPAVQAVVGIAPPRFCHEHWINHPRADAFRESFQTAKQLIDAGDEKQLMKVTQPIPLHITAGNFYDKYGPDDTLDYVPHLREVDRDTFIIVGTGSTAGSPAFHTLPEEFAKIDNPHFRYEIVEGANTPFSGCERAPFEIVRRRMPVFRPSCHG